MGALDDLLLSQQPQYGDSFNAQLFPQPAPAPAPLESFDAAAPGAAQPAPSPFDFLPQEQQLTFAGEPAPLPGKPGTPGQAMPAMLKAASVFNGGQSLSGGTPAAQATPVGSYPVTQTFLSAPGEYGIDLATPVGTPIRAPWGGTVMWEQKGKADWGNRVFVKAPNGWIFAVGHLTRFMVANGAKVAPGQVIGLSGGALNDPNSGNSTGPHIEPQLINPMGQYVDPLPWLRSVWQQSGRSQDEIAGTPPPAMQPVKAVARPPAVAAPPSARDQLAAGFRGRMTTVPATSNGPSPGDVLGALGRVPGQVSDAIGAAGNAVAGPFYQVKPPNAPEVASWYNDQRAFTDARGAKQMAPVFADLPVDQQQAVADAYNQQQKAKFTSLNPLDPLGNLVSQKLLYQIGEGEQRYGPYEQATAEQRAEAIDAGNQAITFPTLGLAGAEGALQRLSTPALRTALTGKMDALTAAGINKASDLTGRTALAQGERQLGLPGVGKEVAAGAAPVFDQPTLQRAAAQDARLAAQRGQLNLGQDLRPGVKQAIQGGFDLLKDFDQPGMGLKETAAAMRAGLWGGKVNEAHQAIEELASTSPEQQQAVALARVMKIDAELTRLHDQQLAGADVRDAIQKQETLLAVYSKAARDVVSGWSHELGPTMQQLIDSIVHPYTLKQDALGGDAMPKDPVLAIRYQGGMRNAVFNLGDMIRRYMKANLKSPQQWDDLAWEMEQGNKFQNRQLETRAVEPGAPVQRIEPAPGGGLRQVPSGEFAGQRIISPQIKALATLLRAANDAMGVYLTEYRSGEFFSAMRDNFWSRKVIGWRDPVTGKTVPKADLARFRAGPGRGLQLSPDSPHFQPRTMQEGLDQLEGAGWVVLKNPAQNVPEYWNSVAQAVSNKNILNVLKTSFKASDGRPIAIEGSAGRRPVGAEGYHHILPNLNAWVHPDAWKMVESQFDVSQPGKILGPLHRFGEVYRELNMVNPLVHTINQSSHQLFQTLVPLRLWIMGHQLAKDPGIVREASVYTYIRPRRAATEYSEAMKGVTNPGLTNPFTQGYQQEAADRGWSLPGASAHVALDTTLLPLRAAVDAGHTFLFEFVIRNAQMATYALEKEKLLKMGMDPEQARLIAGIRADRLVGAINPMTKNSFERKWASLIFFAYNWSKTHVMQALESTPALGRQVLKAEHPYLTDASLRMLEEELTWSAFRGITSALFYSNAMNYVLAGHPMWENEQGRELDWEYTQFARDHLGYTGTQRLYIDAMPMRWINFFFQPLQAYRRQGENSLGAAANAASDWGTTKLMPPLSAILAWKSDDDPNKTAAFIRALETSIPLQRQLTALTGDTVLGPQTIGDLQKAIEDVQAGLRPGGVMSPQAQRLLLNLSAFGLGENPVKKGPVKTIPAEQQKGYAAAQFDRKVALELATNQGLGWATAGELAKEKARRAVMDRPDGGEIVAQQQEDAFKAMQAKAISEMAGEHNDANLDQVDLSPAAQQKMQATGQNPMDLLDNFEKAELFKKYPQLSLYHQAPDLNPDERVRAVKNQTAEYHVRVSEKLAIARAEQEQSDAQLRQGTISFQAWRDQRTQLLRTLYDQDTGSITSLARELPDALTTKEAYDAFQQRNGAPIGTATQRDIAYNAYKAISLDDPQYTLPDGSQDALAWKADRDRALSQLPKAEQDYIKLKESSSWTDAEFLYHQLANRYLQFEQEHADAVHLYHQMFQETNTVQARRAFEVHHPELYGYTIARTAFMRHNPLVAEAFAHGSVLFKALASHGVNPRSAPSQQIAQLLSKPQPGLDLNRPNGGTTQAQLQQEFAQGFGVPPDQQLPGPGGPSVDLTSLLASLTQPGAGQVTAPEQKGALAASLYQ